MWTSRCLPGGSLGPSLSDDEVTGVGEGDGVSVGLRLEVDVAAGLVVLVVVLAGDEGTSLGSAELEVRDVSDGSGKGRASDGRNGENDRAEGNHFEVLVVFFWCWW